MLLDRSSFVAQNCNIPAQWAEMGQNGPGQDLGYCRKYCSSGTVAGRKIRAEVSGHEHGHVGARMSPACGRTHIWDRWH